MIVLASCDSDSVKANLLLITFCYPIIDFLKIIQQISQHSINAKSSKKAEIFHVDVKHIYFNWKCIQH